MEDCEASALIEKKACNWGHHPQQIQNVMNFQLRGANDMICRACLVFPRTFKAVAAMWPAVRPASANWSFGAPCSM